jgi:hypothetical protein
MEDDLQNGDRLTAISAATVYFLRPTGDVTDPTAHVLFRSDKSHEYASLYNPYWQAQLAPVDATTKAGFYALIGANPTLAPVTP